MLGWRAGCAAPERDTTDDTELYRGAVAAPRPRLRCDAADADEEGHEQHGFRSRPCWWVSVVDREWDIRRGLAWDIRSNEGFGKCPDGLGLPGTGSIG